MTWTDPATKGEEGITPLHLAAKLGGRDVVERLIKHITDAKQLDKLDVCDEYGQTPLHYTCFRRHNRDAAKLLISANANVNAKDKQDISVLHLACTYGRASVPFLI